MAGDADMDRDEMVARIALLEAFVVKLAELEARRAKEKDGDAGVAGLLHVLDENAALRCHQMPEAMREAAQNHCRALLDAIKLSVTPKAAGAH